MTIDVIFQSGRKGSNPGGLCKIENGNPSSSFLAYLKFCYGPAHIPHSSFRGDHQPLYEQATFELAKFLGLYVPPTYILVNPNHDVRFHDWKKFEKNDPSGRPFYFVSRIIDSPIDREPESGEIAREIVEAERPYLEAIHVSDVVGRRQNYVLCNINGGNKRVAYVDLGCSFVHAHDGLLSKPTKNKINGKKDVKRAVDRLSRHALIGADNLKVVLLSDLPGFLEDMEVPTLNNYGRTKLKNILSSEEMSEMRDDLLSCFIDELKIFKEAGLILD